MEFKIALHYGDDNDNNISRFNMEGATKDSILDTLEKAFRNGFQGDPDDITIDGDDNSLLIMWYENDIPYHHDYYIETD